MHCNASQLSVGIVAAEHRNGAKRQASASPWGASCAVGVACPRARCPGGATSRAACTRCVCAAVCRPGGHQLAAQAVRHQHGTGLLPSGGSASKRLVQPGHPVAPASATPNRPATSLCPTPCASQARSASGLSPESLPARQEAARWRCRGQGWAGVMVRGSASRLRQVGEHAHIDLMRFAISSAKTDEGLCASRCRIKDDTGQAITRRFGEADIARNDGVEDFGPEVALELLADLLLQA